MLSNIRFVLVEPTHPGNIGGAARAMKNMGLEHLYLVSPARFPDDEARVRASGADDVLDHAVVCASLQDALSDCSLVLGTSARLRSLRWPQLDPRQAAETVRQAAETGHIAVVFGRERTGLTNVELELCHYLVHIPCNEAFSSLNLAAAVQVLAYEISYPIGQGDEQPLQAGHDQTASHQQMQGFYQHLEETLIRIDFLDPQQPRQLMRRLRRLFNRAQPDQTEINILRGMLTAVEKGVKR